MGAIKRSVFLEQSIGSMQNEHEFVYKVTKVVNSVEPRVGDFLDDKQVLTLINGKMNVTITGVKK